MLVMYKRHLYLQFTRRHCLSDHGQTGPWSVGGVVHLMIVVQAEYKVTASGTKSFPHNAWGMTSKSNQPLGLHPKTVRI